MGMPSLVTVFQSVYSMALLIFSIVCIMALIAEKMTKFARDANPTSAYILLWMAILWLTMIEGSQASLVGLSPVNRELYKDSHQIAYKCSQVCHTGDNLGRFLVGRQFMVVIVVFCVNLSGVAIDGATPFDFFPQWVNDIFFTYDGAMILFTCMVGQLNTQVNASLRMLDYVNSYFAIFTVYVAMAIEFSGILHVCYLVQMAVAKISGAPIKSQEPVSDDLSQHLFFYARCIFSSAVLVFSFVVTLTALFQNKTTMWEGVSPTVAVIVFFLLMCVVGMLEGMQIAFFAVAKLPAAERSGNNTWALKTCDLLYSSGEGLNLPRFMVGRQLCAVSCMLFIARVTSVQVPDDGSDNLFGVSKPMQELFNTGFLGAFLTTTLASVSWQLIATAFPSFFLSNPLSYFLLRFCLILESTGICRGAWVLAYIHKKIAGFQRDEVYIGTAESRAETEISLSQKIV